MFTTTTGRTALVAVALLAAPLAVSAQGQPQSQTPTQPAVATDQDVLTTVYGNLPPISQLERGPELDGIITARQGNRIQVTTNDGASTIITLHDETRVRTSGGFLGIGSKTLDRAALLNGLPVAVKTVQYAEGLVASEVRFKSGDLDTASMIRAGTSQQFAQQGAAIQANTAAAEALRGRLGDIDKYNLKNTTNVYFDTGKSVLKPGAREELCATAREADANENSLMLVLGYTDSTGSQELNQTLSEKRAAAVVNHLQQVCKWKPYRMLTPTGMATADPAADNTTEAGRAQNRRVSVNVLVSKALDGQ